MIRDTAFMHRNVPFRLVSITASKSASFIIIRRPSRVTPALFTRMSIRPNSLTAASIRAFTWASSATLHCTASALAPRASQAATVSWAASARPA